MLLSSDAIAIGAPIYNTGPHGHVACAQIYTAAAQQAAEIAGDDDDVEARRLLKTALHTARTCGRPSEGAWALRHAFDAVIRRRKVATPPRSKAAGKQASRQHAGGASALQHTGTHAQTHTDKSHVRPATPSASPPPAPSAPRAAKPDLKAAARRAIHTGQSPVARFL